MLNWVSWEQLEVANVLTLELNTVDFLLRLLHLAYSDNGGMEDQSHCNVLDVRILWIESPTRVGGWTKNPPGSLPTL